MIELYATGQSLKCATPVIAADSIGYLTVKVSFDHAWSGYSKWIHFRHENGTTVRMFSLELHNDSLTESDGLNLTEGEWLVHLTGISGQSRLTTVPVVLTVRESGMFHVPLEQLPLSVAEQLSYKVDEALRAIDTILYRPGLVVSGFKDDLAHLTGDVPNPYPGEAYAVGRIPPYDVYIWDGGGQRWRNAGPLVDVLVASRTGVLFTPTVDGFGNLSWANNGGLPDPDVVNIMGPQGPKGDTGTDGKSAYDLAIEAGYTGDRETFSAALVALPAHAARHLPGGADPITVREDNLANGAVTAAKLAAGAVSTVYSVSVGIDWTGNAAPYTKEIPVSGLAAGDRVAVDILPSEESFSAAQAQLDAYALIYRVKVSNGKLTLYAIQKPTTAFTLQVLAVKK